MREIVRADQDKLHEHELVAMEKHGGKTFEWHTLNGMFQARRAVDAIEAASNSGKLTAAAIQQPEQRMQAAFDEGKAYAQAHSGEKTRLGNKPLWFSLDSNFETVLTKIKELRRDVSASKPEHEVSRDLEILERQLQQSRKQLQYDRQGYALRFGGNAAIRTPCLCGGEGAPAGSRNRHGGCGSPRPQDGLRRQRPRFYAAGGFSGFVSASDGRCETVANHAATAGLRVLQSRSGERKSR